MRRITLLSAATATALAASMLTGSAVATADGTADSGPVLDTAATTYDHPGTVSVTAHSDHPITRIAAHFTRVDAQDGAPEAGSTSDFTQQYGEDGRSGVWRAPVHLAELGDYRVTVDLEDSSGATVTGAVSPLKLEYRTVLAVSEFTVTPAAPDYLHQRVTLSGTVLAEDPRTPDTAVPAGDVPVSVDGRHGRRVATTGADGRFTTSFVPTWSSDDLTAWPVATAAHPGAVTLGTREARQVTAVAAPTRFTASTHALDLRQGATGTVTGRAEIQTAGGWQPLAGAPLSLLGLDADGRTTFLAAQTTTDEQGLYTLRVPTDNPAPTGELLLGGTPFLRSATQPFSLHVAYTTHLDLWAALGDDSRLSVSGQIYYGDPRAHWPAKPTVTIEYSKDGKAGWKSAATLPLRIRHNKANIQEEFATKFTAPPDAYWRARFAGNPDLAGSTTKPVHLRRYATRITGFNVSPEPVRKNGRLHFSGTLQYKPGGVWKPLAGESPALYFRARGASSYRFVTDLSTDSHGRIRDVVLNAVKDGTWAVAFDRQTGPRFLRSARVTDYVDVR
ncbi:hypothetical protein [Actinacidiphila glaucinigra]|uniref:hypothetical protein n=1 Tax=Actinacidiphila glaucinigra TaxID=235986 RepID=UPI003672D955